MQILHRILFAQQSERHLGHLPDVRPQRRIRFQHIPYQLMHLLRILGTIRHRKRPTLNRQRTLAERQHKKQQLVQHTAQRPNVRLARNIMSRIQIHHFGRPIRQRRILLDLLLHRRNAVRVRIQNPRRRRTEIAQHKVSAIRLQDVLDFQITMHDRRLTVMQPRHRLANVAEDLQHLLFGEADRQASVHHGQHVVAAERHQQQHLVDAVRAERDTGIDVADDVLVAGQVAL